VDNSKQGKSQQVLVRGGYKIPMLGAHITCALLILIAGLVFLYPLSSRVVDGEHLEWFSKDTWREIIETIGLVELPRVMIGLSLMLMTLGLLARARIAWAFSIVLMLAALFIDWFSADQGISVPLIYHLVSLGVLIYLWPAFNRSSLAAGTLFALASFASLVWYAMLGVLYLGAQFNPPITEMAQAAYFSVVAMSTVGFGDIVPVTPVARLFVISIIVLGITVFATSLGAVIGPLVGGRLRQIIQRKARLAMRKNHIILCGATPLALNLYETLSGRGESVTVIVRPSVLHPYPETTDLILGDPSSAEVLLEAGVKNATYVLALRDDDADNAFIVLAVKSFTDSSAKTVALVNNSQNLEKIHRVKPDLAFSPQLLGAELLSRAMLGETFDNKMVTEILFGRVSPFSKA
jgi:voltage-gated potassium channel